MTCAKTNQNRNKVKNKTRNTEESKREDQKSRGRVKQNDPTHLHLSVGTELCTFTLYEYFASYFVYIYSSTRQPQPLLPFCLHHRQDERDEQRQANSTKKKNAPVVPEQRGASGSLGGGGWVCGPHWRSPKQFASRACVYTFSACLSLPVMLLGLVGVCAPPPAGAEKPKTAKFPEQMPAPGYPLTLLSRRGRPRQLPL